MISDSGNIAGGPSFSPYRPRTELCELLALLFAIR
jgi:hypothetical protein